jgi:hypothetical protein
VALVALDGSHDNNIVQGIRKRNVSSIYLTEPGSIMQAPLAKKTAMTSISALVNDQDVLEEGTGLDDKVDGALERRREEGKQL